jgi:hypothetical protein
MKNLNELGVQEMDVREIQKVDGGFIYLLIGAAIGALMSQDLDALVDAYNEGYAAAQN